MLRWPAMKGEISPFLYAAVAPLLLLSQNGVVALVYWLEGRTTDYDWEFWLLPMRKLALLPGLSPLEATAAFAFALAVAWALALLSFRRAARSRIGFALAALAVVPAFQIAAVLILAVMPIRAEPTEPAVAAKGMNVAHVIQGMLAGIAIIVFAVLVSAVTFGAYGWGLFVMTPLTVGLNTAYLANREEPLESGTIPLVMAALGLGGLALIMFALEGAVCILLVAPLAIVVALVGASVGQHVAAIRYRRGRPFLTVALLPAVFALEAAMPPSATIATDEAIDIAAPPAAVWQALTSDAPIAAAPGLVGEAGLAYAVRGQLLGTGVGAGRLGEFSTGTARERVTEWVPGRRLAFTVLSQPPAMEEMSPYRRVHAPHVQGYFETGETRFTLEPLRGGGTRLRAQAAHVLRLDPVLYWEPLARWAAGANTRRVLRDIRDKAQAATGRDR